jgi:hypothetical protein
MAALPIAIPTILFAQFLPRGFQLSSPAVTPHPVIVFLMVSSVEQGRVARFFLVQQPEREKAHQI